MSGGPWLVLTAEMGKVGAYSCEYWAVRDGRNIYSARSQPVQVPVMDCPLAPSISAISDRPGKSPVTIECSAPPGHMAKSYQFLRQGNVIISQPSAYLQLCQSDLDATGPYTCSYEISVSGRMIQSLPSAPLSIHLTGPEFTTGDFVTLTCSAPSWEKKMQFCFLKAGEQVACTRLGARGLSELPDWKTQHGGFWLVHLYVPGSRTWAGDLLPREPAHLHHSHRCPTPPAGSKNHSGPPKTPLFSEGMCQAHLLSSWKRED
ncbi:uncharacterized protein LOC117886227 isoform X2 [Trachemys scripta elegans]|uniref:uncharacterized protein LOC117886227 isoform X2 n=1 Tax=Trachemys scripta elegans TaxID=31138 RepID=UPI00155599AD|nr:uncharacterized protein LOC117886227 isoform X2 [Trachemys scripta elegans]